MKKSPWKNILNLSALFFGQSEGTLKSSNLKVRWLVYMETQKKLCKVLSEYIRIFKMLNNYFNLHKFNKKYKKGNPDDFYANLISCFSMIKFSHKIMKISKVLETYCEKCFVWLRHKLHCAAVKFLFPFLKKYRNLVNIYAENLLF